MPDTGEIKNKLAKVVEELSAETQQVLRTKITRMNSLLDEISQSNAAATVPASDTVDLTALKETCSTLKDTTGQSEIISAILDFAGTCVQRAAVFAFKNKKLYGWQATGVQTDNPAEIVSIKKIVIDATQPSPFSEVLKKHTSWIGKYTKNPILDSVLQQLSGPLPKEICIFPLAIKDRVIAVLYGDNHSASRSQFQTDSLEIMTTVASLVMENVSLARRGPAETEQKPKEEEVEISTRPVKTKSSQPLEELDEETRKIHEKAKRTARVIVGDIALYNKAKIEQGMASGNLSDLIREDVTKGRELYNQRVPAEITNSTNYYEETLIEMIAKGNRKILGL